VDHQQAYRILVVLVLSVKALMVGVVIQML
jgi:hypothetical protein